MKPLEKDINLAFDLKKEKLLSEIPAGNSQCHAIILGGQPASGKSSIIKKNNIVNYLFINVDDYRKYHPDVDNLIRLPGDSYSKETQVYSQIFTERLLGEAVERRMNVIVEGTMRNPDVPAKTAKLFKENGYSVSAYVIAAHPLFTELGVYYHYLREVEAVGYGRLTEIASHNAAVTGLPASVDLLYRQKLADELKIFPFQAHRPVATFALKKI